MRAIEFMKRFATIPLFVILGLVVIAITYMLVTFPPIMAGMAAKTMCSCVYVTERTAESVVQKELQVFPGLSSAIIEFNDIDSTVTSKILWKTRKAIYRKGVGCTLLAEADEKEIRQQKIATPPSPSGNQDSIAWPLGNLTNDSMLSKVNQAIIMKSLDEAFLEHDREKPLNTHAIVIVHNGQIIGERYAPGFNRDSRLMGWSMTKSITSALIGILVMDGKLKVEAPAPVPKWSTDDRKKITLNNLLQATSGLKWSESYFFPGSTFHNMFTRRDDKAGYAKSLTLDHTPGEYFQYSSGTTLILSSIIRQTVGDDQYYKFPYERLFYKTGMNHAILEPDASGTFVSSSYCYATARDWARFGLLYLNDGVVNGERILPEGWVKYSTTPSSAAPLGEYGAQWWLNHGAKENTNLRKYPELPPDAYWADGFEEQFVMVIPSKKLVIVRLGVSHHGFDFSKLANDIITSLPDGM